MPFERLTEYMEFLLSQGFSRDQLQVEIDKLKAEAARATAQVEKKTKPRPRGSGSVYQKPGSRYWWCSFFVNGERHQESTEHTDRWKATKYLQKRMAEAAAGKVAPADVESATVETLVTAMFSRKLNQEIKGGKHVFHEVGRYNKNLEPFFGKVKARKVTDALISAYIAQRKKAKASNGSINRELAIIQRALKLAKVPGPKFPRLPETNTRQGFLDDAKRDALLRECGKVGLWLRAMTATAATFGFRRGELVNLRVRAIDLAHSTLRVEHTETKTGEARQVKLTPDLRVLLEACIAGKNADALVFTREDGGPAGNFYMAWETCCKRAGCPGLLFHDLRRTAVRNMIRAGIPERVAMAISGHKTRSIFDRYNIVSESDLTNAATKLAAFASATALLQSQQLSGDVENSKIDVKAN